MISVRAPARPPGPGGGATMSAMHTRVMTVFGTRPEAIKMAPVVAELRKRPETEVVVVVSGQHREMLRQVLALFDIQPDLDLAVMSARQPLHDLLARIVAGVGDALSRIRPDLVLVHGDTSTTLAAALAAFHCKVPVGHVEAGLRTGDMHSPWPEEANRRLTAPLADMHFAPTARARANLLAEGIREDTIHVTGNTVVDALQGVARRISTDQTLEARLAARFAFREPTKKLVLVTGHRRENFGGAFERVCSALATIARRPDTQLIYPVHLNPSVQEPVHRLLGDVPGAFLMEPLDYPSFVYLMSRADLVITDSGGIQEEAPSLGVPVLVTRDTTERPEAVAAGTVRLVGTGMEAIVASACELLDDPEAHRRMSLASNPFGDGQAARRIVDVIAASLPAPARP